MFIPQYISRCVIDTINKVCTPVFRLTDKTKAIILFHHFGYPQKMDEINKIIGDRQLLVIEDCAHSFDSQYRGKRVGTFGDIAIFSFPKFFPTILGGCLVTGDERILTYAYNYLKSNRSFWKEVYHNFILFFTIMNTGVKNSWIRYITSQIEIKNGQIFHKIPNPNKRVCRLFAEEFKDARYSEKRRANYEFIKHQLRDCKYLAHLEEESEVVPFTVPYVCREPERIRSELQKFNILVGVEHHFDMNRNIFCPQYKEVVALPVHQYISQKEISYVLKTLRYVEEKIN